MLRTEFKFEWNVPFWIDDQNISDIAYEDIRITHVSVCGLDLTVSLAVTGLTADTDFEGDEPLTVPAHDIRATITIPLRDFINELEYEIAFCILDDLEIIGGTTNNPEVQKFWDKYHASSLSLGNLEANFDVLLR